MAEIVQSRAESMLQEIENLRQIKLFSEEKIRRIIQTRKRMDAKINRNYSKDIEDYKDYIAHEHMVLEKVRRCRDKKKISEKKSSIDYSIIRRIRRLYETALQRFPNDYSMHEGFFNFCKENSFHTTASQAIENMQKMFSHKPEVWKLAASWYCHMNDINKALHTLHKGLTLNPESLVLYSTAIELEISQVTNLECTPEEKLSKENQCCEKIKTYVNLIFKNVKNLDYFISILSILESHNFTNSAQQVILEYLLKNYAKEDIVWHTMAQREKKGTHFVTDPNERPKSSSFTKSCIMYSSDKYLQGLKMVAPEKKKKLWSYYLETLITIKEENHTAATLSRVEFLKDALQQAHNDQCLEERHYTVWADIVDDEEARTILQEATDIYSESVQLWKMRLRYDILTDKVKRIESTFKLGEMALKEKAGCLWLMVLRFHQLISDNEKIKAIFEDGIRKAPAVSDILKPKYLEWLAFHEGIDEARSMYRSLATEKPYCKALHTAMSKLEFSEMNVNHEKWQEVHELAIQQFGSEDIDVWVHYIKFFLFLKPDEYGEKVVKVHDRAKECLPPLLWQQFSEIYTIMLAEK